MNDIMRRFDWSEQVASYISCSDNKKRRIVRTATSRIEEGALLERLSPVEARRGSLTGRTKARGCITHERRASWIESCKSRRKVKHDINQLKP